MDNKEQKLLDAGYETAAVKVMSQSKQMALAEKSLKLVQEKGE